MIIAMAGLPGTGRSTLARELADQLAGALLDKDYIRSHRFSTELIEHSREQDDFCFEMMLMTTAWLLNRDPAAAVLLDGHTLTRSHEVSALRAFADGLGQDLRIIECTCPERLALARLAANRAMQQNRSPHVDAEMYYTLRERAEPIRQPKIVIDTTQPVHMCAVRALDFAIQGSTTTSPAR
jgi:predicted kinase